MGLADQMHHDQHKYLATGGWDWFEPPTYISGVPAVGSQQAACWAFQILPHMEAQNVWKGGSGPTDLDRVLLAVGTPNSNYFCPSRRSPMTITYSDPGYMGGTSITHAQGDYAASNLNGTGATRRYVPRSLAELSDGTSNTMLIGEKRMNRAHLGQWQEDDNEGYTAGWDEDTMRRTDVGPAADYSAANGDGDERFGSSHRDIFNAAFADGSVRPIPYSINPTVFEYLGNVNDGQAVGEY